MTTNVSKPLPRPAGILLAGLGVFGVALAAGGAPSCIIPDEGIVAMTDCGIQWCITADSARGVKNGQIENIQEGGGYPTACVCMTEADGAVMQAGILVPRTSRRSRARPKTAARGTRAATPAASPSSTARRRRSWAPSWRATRATS